MNPRPSRRAPRAKGEENEREREAIGLAFDLSGPISVAFAESHVALFKGLFWHLAFFGRIGLGGCKAVKRRQQKCLKVVFN